MAHAAHAAPVITAGGEIRPAAPAPARERWSWALYDFANTIWSMNIATYYFNVWLISDLQARSTAVAIANGISSALVAVSIPILGAISDARQRRKPWVVGFTLLCVLATLAIGVIGATMVPPYGEAVVGGVPRPADWAVAGNTLVLIIGAFVVANYAYQGALPFYNAMLPELVPADQQGRLSGLGTALGYVGSIIGIALTTPFFNATVAGVLPLPDAFVGGLRDIVPFTASGGRVAAFVPTALLFLLFAVPLFLFTRDHNAGRVARQPIRIGAAFRTVIDTFRQSRRYPGALRFILATFLYQDAIGTIISFFAVYAVEARGFTGGTEASLFIVLTVPAVFGSLFFGWLTDRIGPKRTIGVVLTLWIVLLVALILIPGRGAFWAIGLGVGLIFGGLWTAERPMMLTLVPDVEAGRFFSLMVLSARAAAIVGPFFWAFAVDGLTAPLGKTTAYSIAIAIMAAFFLGALLLLRGVPDRWSRRAPPEPREAVA